MCGSLGSRLDIYAWPFTKSQKKRIKKAEKVVNRKVKKERNIILGKIKNEL